MFEQLRRRIRRGGPRPTRETSTTAKLLAAILRAASKKSARLTPGTHFTVEVPKGFDQVNHLELTAGLLNRPRELGLVFVGLIDGKVTFRKT